MSTWFVVWLVLAGAIVLLWLVRLGIMLAAMGKRRVLKSTSFDGPPENPPFLSVIVAAKDEQDNIEACVRWLMEQDYPSYEIIVVDDRSRDDTPGILARLRSSPEGVDGKLRVITVNTLRDGWFGKTNAMREGVAASRGEWLVFTDADCRSARGSQELLSMAMREALANDVDFLSITPVLEMPSVWERIVQPICALALILWFLPSRVNDPQKKTAYANGAFMALRRSCYEQIGGHEVVKTEVNEDVHLARLTKKMGLRLRVVENEDLYRTRMYRTPGEAWRGWSRIFYGSLGSMPRLLISAALVLLLAIIPWVSFAVAVVGGTLADPEHATLWTGVGWVWFGIIAFEQTVVWRFFDMVRVNRFWSLAYVLGGFVTLGIIINAMLKTIGATGTTWRGTHYRGDRRLEPETPAECEQPVDLEPTKEAVADA